jgi:threonine/homoserine/homoserine lactone efflux protein
LPNVQILLFLATSAALIVHPGTNMLYVLTRAVGGGRKVGLVSVAGVGVGQLANTAAAALGLSALLAQSALAFSVVKWAGACYLIYLGVKTLLGKRTLPGDPDGGTGEGVETSELPKVFRQGAISSVLNPQLALFFLSYLPQFVDREAGSVTAQVAALGLLYTLLALSIYGAVALFSGTVGGWLAESKMVSGGLRWASGCVFVGLGLRLAFSERR